MELDDIGWTVFQSRRAATPFCSWIKRCGRRSDWIVKTLAWAVPRCDFCDFGAFFAAGLGVDACMLAGR